MKYGTTLYKDNDIYRVLKFSDRSTWLKGRKTGIGGSDASAALGMNRWKTNRDLWKEKTGRADPEDISDKDVVIYGQRKEPDLRKDFAIDFEDIYEVQYMDNVTLQSVEHPELLYSPDGLLIEKETGRKGILEIKTHAVRTSADWNDWREKIGINEYYIQVLHGLNVTGFAFVELRAELKRSNQYKQIRTYHIDTADYGVLEDIEFVSDGVLKFWNEYVVQDREPGLILPAI